MVINIINSDLEVLCRLIMYPPVYPQMSKVISIYIQIRGLLSYYENNFMISENNHLRDSFMTIEITLLPTGSFHNFLILSLKTVYILPLFFTISCPILSLLRIASKL